MRLPIVGFIRMLLLFALVSTFWSLINGSENKENTLAIIKPDGLLGNYTDDIKKTILEYGFCILKEKRVQLDEETVERFYADHSSKYFFTSLVKYMTSGQVLLMILEKENAIADWRALMGPMMHARLRLLTLTASEQCVVWTLKGIVFMAQILLIPRIEKYYFSSKSHLQMWLLIMMNCS